MSLLNTSIKAQWWKQLKFNDLDLTSAAEQNEFHSTKPPCEPICFVYMMHVLRTCMCAALLALVPHVFFLLSVQFLVWLVDSLLANHQRQFLQFNWNPSNSWLWSFTRVKMFQSAWRSTARLFSHVCTHRLYTRHSPLQLTSMHLLSLLYQNTSNQSCNFFILPSWHHRFKIMMCWCKAHVSLSIIIWNMTVPRSVPDLSVRKRDHKIKGSCYIFFQHDATFFPECVINHSSIVWSIMVKMSSQHVTCSWWHCTAKWRGNAHVWLNAALINVHASPIVVTVTTSALTMVWSKCIYTRLELRALTDPWSRGAEAIG